jgi:hypothetical protein
MKKLLVGYNLGKEWLSIDQDNFIRDTNNKTFLNLQELITFYNEKGLACGLEYVFGDGSTQSIIAKK